jgi:hypothetical protein
VNNDRRKTLNKLRATGQELKAKIQEHIDALLAMEEDFDDLYNGIEQEHSDEEEGYENLPEGFQNGERGEQMQEAINYMDEAMSAIEEFKSSLSELSTRVQLRVRLGHH